MKICIVAMTGLYPLDIGGPAPVAYFLAKELNRNGIDVYMFIRADEKKFNRLQKSNEIKELDKTKLMPINIEYDFKTSLNVFYVFSKIREVNKEFKEIIDDADVILYNSPPVDIAFGFPFIAKRKAKKQVFVLHGGLFYESKNMMGKLLIRLQKNLFDKVIPVSAFSRDIALKFGFNVDKIEIIPNGVDLKLFDVLEPLGLEGSPKILSVGRLSRIKCLDTLLRAFSLFIKDLPNAHLYIVGDGPERLNLERLSKSLDITDNVHFEGFIPPGIDVYKYYKSCDLFIMTSRKENFPMTIIEAMGSGIPVIATDIEGGPRELIKQGVNGFLFPIGDYRTLAEEAIKILENDELRKEFILKNYSIVSENYTWDKIASRYIEVFEELLCEGKGTPLLWCGC